MTRNRRELAVMESLDSGKTIRDCELIDISEAIHTIKWHAEAADKIYDQTAPHGDEALAMILHEPVGVVGAVLPWNFPLLMLAWKIGPALAAGHSVIVKPAEQTSLTALRVAELAAEAGVPRGVLQVLPGDGPSVGAPMGLHPGIDMISFTGSTETGRRFLCYAADSNLKRIVLECGGKNPAVVLEDAEHLDLVAGHVVNAAFWNMGGNCSANSRLIVHKRVKVPLMERIIARTRDWRTGDPLDPANHLGALVDAEHCAKVTGYLDAGKPIIGGKAEGNFVAPTIFDGVKPGDRLAREEIFGPVLSVIEVASTQEAIEVANDTDYGLAAKRLHGERQGRAAGGAGDPGGNGDSECLWRRGRHHAVRRLQALGFRRARQGAARARAIHRGQDHLNRPLRCRAGGRGMMLAALAYTQVVRKGRPAIYGHYLSTVSMASGAPMAGTPEISLMNFMIGQMARFYGFPWRTSNTLGGAKTFDAQAGYESATTMMAVLMSGANYIWHSAGWNEAGMHCSVAKFVVDAEQCAMGYRMAEGIRWDDFDEALAAVRDVGPGGHYLGHPHTLANFGRAFFMPKLFDNNSVEHWMADGSREITERALIEARAMLAAYEEPKLDPGVDEACATISRGVSARSRQSMR